jgi:hypothetical protein
LADTIAQADVEVLEETEAKLESEYTLLSIKQAAFDVEMQRWKILRAECRSILTHVG